MHHSHPVFDEAFLVQISTQLAKQRDELNRLRQAKAASGRSKEQVKPPGRRSRSGLGDLLSSTGSRGYFIKDEL